MQPRLQISKHADGFRVPWSLGMLPDGDMLISERAGRLWRAVDSGHKTRIRGLPRIDAKGQGGLHDIVPARDFTRTGTVFLAYAKPQGGGQGTALAIARLAGDRLEELREVFAMSPGSSGGRHFGGRIVEGRDGTLFLSIGDRGDRSSAQDLSRHNGSIIRINRDGSVPADNPFLALPGARPEIWSYGHRNPQGMALDAKGRLWAHEHGAMGGDELNAIRRGANYGWPVIAYGRHYSGAKIGEGTHKPGMEQPAFYWDPSIAPSGLAIYSGRLWPQWQGAFLVGSLKFDHIAVLSRDGSRQIGKIDTPETQRVRDFREGPDGAIWFLSEGKGALYRITPA
ncbi:PQQ-dependent sugar dehydrogenase [Alisedimentitalea sp. MJ-SS2]|uniref:PQQ-dependent sugar dehydrogenase n=1 Tax=Aliisedimentitalea sp. MJ-SS2 TaxID=3049795 RepID=UPI002908D4B3|nr:PQQ-dependent sugar dehydrogenase [Alisedimentitalea sp. MJ-SS2]MDU8926916.1 PQQ-dependent sugar dehydrogenase [Alisedimentitalea sp. MJ-SS2]